MSESFTPDNLIAGAFPIVREQGTVKISAGALARGEVMGKITKGDLSQAFAGTDNGVLTLDATTPKLANAQAGAYKVKCITAATNGGTFEVFDPKGNSLGIVAVGATFANQIKFAIADGATDFVAGDLFTITIAAGSGQLAAYDSTALDGTEEPYGILLEPLADAATTQGGLVALTGEFSSGALSFAHSGDTAASVKSKLRALGIYLKDTAAA